MRIDSHVHFWRFAAADYPWMSEDMRALRRNCLTTDAHALFQQADIDGCVAVQARMSEAETDFLLELAAMYPWIAAVVGWVDLANDRLAQHLERWRDAKCLAGFRHILQNDPAAGDLVASADFRRGVSLLQQRALIYELLISAEQLPHMAEFCRTLDSHWLVLDHLGKPDIRNRQFDSWLRDVKPLAELPHVVCKLSGIVTEANDASGAFEETHIRRYLDAALELFGARRLMFGSDWPVCTLVASHAETTAIIERWCSRLSASERDWLWRNTAAAVYGLDPAPR
ncbi:MAG: amidohydrolase family protein [Pseudomonadota bacterium]